MSREIGRCVGLAVMAALVSIGLGGVSRAAEYGPYEMELLIDGQPVTEYDHRGTTYVEARRGREYAIRLTNHTGRRVAVALAIDGLNSIDAKTTSANKAAKWILDPWESITVDGWQTSDRTARAFYFTSEPQSYGAWLGQTANLGIVSAAFFREREHRRHDDEIAPSAPMWNERQGGASEAPRGEGKRGPDSDSSSAAEGSTRDERMQQPMAKDDRKLESQREADDYAATGIGRERDNQVRRIRFAAESAAAAQIDLRYEYRRQLVQLGVVPRYVSRGDALSRRERARGFGYDGYAPDPYRWRDNR